MKNLARAIFLLLLLAWPNLAVAAAAEHEACTKDIHGQNICVKNGDNDAAADKPFEFVGRAYDALLQENPDAKKDELFFVPIERDGFDSYSSDKDIGPLIVLAKENASDALVLLVPATSGDHEMQAVLFKGKNPIIYAAGNTLVEARKRIKHIEKNPPSSAPYMRLRPFQIYADNGTPLQAFKIMYNGKPELRWPFDAGNFRYDHQ